MSTNEKLHNLNMEYHKPVSSDNTLSVHEWPFLPRRNANSAQQDTCLISQYLANIPTVLVNPTLDLVTSESVTVDP